jgi:outer membrane protein TolC
MRIDNTWQAILASKQRAELSNQELNFALQMQQAELDKVDLGQSNLLILNLREQASIRASVALIDAKIELLQNLALYQYARGQFDEDWGR